VDQIYRIFTDGSAIGNPGPGGWGVVVLQGEGRWEMSGAVPWTTISDMELLAALEALRPLPNRAQIELRSDSEYLVYGMRAFVFPHVLDQKYLVLLAWGFVVPMVWGFSARWLPAFLAIPKPDAPKLRLALALDLLGVVCGVAGWTIAATLLLASSAVLIGAALHLTQPPLGPPKTQGIHPSFPSFVRIAYAWLAIAGCMSIWAAFGDQHGGIWGASRHALTVGFAATMVFSIGPRILPHFAGVHAIFSKRLMFLSLLLLQTGCLLRVTSEPLAYEGLLPLAWNVLPVSGVLELSAVLLFAANITLTLLLGTSVFALRQSTQADCGVGFVHLSKQLYRFTMLMILVNEGPNHRR